MGIVDMMVISSFLCVPLSFGVYCLCQHHSVCVFLCTCICFLTLTLSYRRILLPTNNLCIHVTMCPPKCVPCLLTKAINVTQAGQPEDKLDLAFRLYDIDRNGVIEEHEMVEIIRVRTCISLFVSMSVCLYCVGGLLYLSISIALLPA